MIIDKPVVVVIMISAVLLTASRIVGPFEVGKDQATQLEVGERLVRGFGLTTTNATPRESHDISIEPSSKYVTNWPPGLSLLVAALLYVGVPLHAAVKILYGTTTLLGWIGWALITSYFISRAVGSGKRPSPVHLFIVALLPFTTTPGWAGTDAFLWAGIPFLFIGLVGLDRKQPSLLSITLAGLLFGSLFAIRYTSLFLGLAAALILFQISYPDLKLFFKRLSVFAVSSLTLMLPVAIYVIQHAQSFTHTSGAINPNDPLGDLATPFRILRALPMTSNLVFGHPVFERFIYSLKLEWLLYASGIIFLIAVLLWPLLLWRGRSEKGIEVKDDTALSFSFLPVSLVVFLVAIGFASQPYYMFVRRYYEVIGLCGIFIFYEIATRRATHRLIKLTSQAVVVGFVLYICVFLPALAFTNEGRESLVSYARGFTPERMFKLYSPKDTAKSKVEELYKNNPDALFYAHHYAWFVYDGPNSGPIPGRNLRSVPDRDFWTRAYTTKPVKVFWVLDREAPLDFIPDSRKQLVFDDSSERMKILVSDFAAGPLVPAEQIAVK